MTDETTILERAADLLTERFDLEPGYASWVAEQLDDADLLGPETAPELQIARLLTTLMAIRRPADAVLACQTLDALPMRWMLNVRQAMAEGVISTEGRLFAAEELPAIVRSVGNLADADIATFAESFTPSFTNALATLIELATRPEFCSPATMPVSIVIDRNLNAPTASLAHFPTVVGTRMTFLYALPKAPTFPFNAEGLEVTARVDGQIIHDLAQLLSPGLPPANRMRPARLAA